MGTRAKQRTKPVSVARLKEMIEEATVDANGEEEQAMGWENVFEEHLVLPFKTMVLGVEVIVERVTMRGDNRIVAICARGRERQAIALLDLPLPSAAPAGAEWIAACKYFLGER